MKQGLLTDRQKEVLRYRKQGLTQQQIAEIIHTSKANVCTIEKAALENTVSIHISQPKKPRRNPYALFCLEKKNYNRPSCHTASLYNNKQYVHYKPSILFS